MADLTHALAELRRLDRPTPIKHPLPTEAELDAVEAEIDRPIPKDFRRYLAEAGNVWVGYLEPFTVIGGGHTHLPKEHKHAAEWGVPPDLFAICHDNADFYCLHPDGRVLYWTHNGHQLTGEEWPDLATWIMECWIAEGLLE